MKENRFYVYALLDPRKPGAYEYEGICFLYEPFYIGKGNKNRCYDHLKDSQLKNNTYKNNKIKTIKSLKLNVIVLKIKEDMTEGDSFIMEKSLISKIGRIDLKTGTLTNVSDGGKGSSGNILSEKSKIKIGEHNAKYWIGKSLSEASIEKMKKTKKANPQDFSWKYRKYKAFSPEGEEFIISDGFQSFCNKYNLRREKMVMVAQGKRKTHKGWRCEYIDIDHSLPKDKIYILTDSKQNEYIVNDIIKFSYDHDLVPKRLYEVAKGYHSLHRGWKCEYYPHS